MVRYGVVWYGMVWYGTVWHDIIRYGTVWYGIVRYGALSYGIVYRVWPCLSKKYRAVLLVTDEWIQVSEV